MKAHRSLLLVFWIVSTLASAATFPISRHHPTQFAVGELEVTRQKAKLAEDIDLDEPWKGKKKLQVVLAPDGDGYLIDGHHHLRAVHELGVKRVEATVADDWSDAPSMASFWRRMVKAERVWLFDETGKARPLADLPRHVGQMKDDPFRSIAWLIRKSGAIEKSEESFAELRWAQFLRQRVSLSHSPGAHAFREAVRESIRVAGSSAAQSLPGAIGFSESKVDGFLAEIEDLLP
jgi:hypothetical protein